jgi:lipoprotein-anchoring transpeptidase ErfK/SrfK
MTPAAANAATNFNVTTTVAISNAVEPIYASPSVKAKVLHHTSISTPDSEALQTYRFISSKRVGSTTWEKIAVPARPNGQSGWVKRSWMASPIVSHTLVVVDQAAEKLTVYKSGKAVFAAPVGIGAPSTPTPTGHFWIAEAFPSNDPFYGPWAFGTTDRAADTEFPDDSIVGIHGTNEPYLIPGDPSHGCVRMKNEDVLKLKTLVAIGSGVWIE